VRFKLDGQLWDRLQIEAERRNVYPSKLASMILELVLSDHLVAAVLDVSMPAVEEAGTSAENKHSVGAVGFPYQTALDLGNALAPELCATVGCDVLG
jgi:hypothetical protein